MTTRDAGGSRRAGRDMRVVEIAEPGGPEVLRAGVRPVPQPGKSEVLITVQAAGVNRPDCLQRRGLYPPPEGASDLPGLEVAGTVAAVGAGVTRWGPGEAVCALLRGGGYAEYALARAGQVLPLPRGLEAVEAAALPEAVFTVWVNVFERAWLQPGETLLVHGGSGGVGSTAIQMACALGARVLATAGSPGRCVRCEELGAELAVSYQDEDFTAAVRAATKGRGVDVVLDVLGGAHLARNLEMLAPDGRLSVIACLHGRRGEVDLQRVMTRRLTVTGSTLRARPDTFKNRVARSVEETVWPLVEAGRIRPVIHRVLPLEEAAEAHRLLEERGHFGKVVLAVPGAG